MKGSGKKTLSGEGWAWEYLDGGIGVAVSGQHRFGTDAFLLAGFAAPRPGEQACDLGTGCGIIPFLWLRPPFPRDWQEEEGLPAGLALKRAPQWRAPARVYGVEIQEQGVEQFKAGIEKNRLEGRVVPVWEDLTQLSRLGQAMGVGKLDLVTCNPPYQPQGEGIPSREDSARIARHESLCTLEQVCAAGAYLLKFGGRFCLCLRPQRLAQALAACQGAGLAPKRLRFVAQRPGKAPWLFLLEARKGGKPNLQVLPQLLVEDPQGGFSREMLDLYHKKRPLPPQKPPLPPGLWLVGVPIGNREDFSPRGRQALEQADLLVVEHRAKGEALCQKLGVQRDGKEPLLDYNQLRRQGFDSLLERLTQGETAALISDAGMPCLADPGFELVALCHSRGIPVHTVPGPGALATALAASGFSASRFSFEGFLSTGRSARQAHLAQLLSRDCPLAFYETARKLSATLADLLGTLGDRPILLARDLTKPGETLLSTTLSQALALGRENGWKGEFVLIVENPGKGPVNGRNTQENHVETEID